MYKNHHGEYCHPFFEYSHYWKRRFLTEEEKKELGKRYKKKKIEWMTRYKTSLENELKGVNERLDKLMKETE